MFIHKICCASMLAFTFSLYSAGLEVKKKDLSNFVALKESLTHVKKYSEAHALCKEYISIHSTQKTKTTLQELAFRALHKWWEENPASSTVPPLCGMFEEEEEQEKYNIFNPDIT